MLFVFTQIGRLNYQKSSVCYEFRNEKNGLFVLGVIFFLDKFQLFN